MDPTCTGGALLQQVLLVRFADSFYSFVILLHLHASNDVTTNPRGASRRRRSQEHCASGDSSRRIGRTEDNGWRRMIGTTLIRLLRDSPGGTVRGGVRRDEREDPRSGSLSQSTGSLGLWRSALDHPARVAIAFGQPYKLRVRGAVLGVSSTVQHSAS